MAGENRNIAKLVSSLGCIGAIEFNRTPSESPDNNTMHTERRIPCVFELRITGRRPVIVDVIGLAVVGLTRQGV